MIAEWVVRHPELIAAFRKALDEGDLAGSVMAYYRPQIPRDDAAVRFLELARAADWEQIVSCCISPQDGAMP